MTPSTGHSNKYIIIKVKGIYLGAIVGSPGLKTGRPSLHLPPKSHPVLFGWNGCHVFTDTGATAANSARRVFVYSNCGGHTLVFCLLALSGLNRKGEGVVSRDWRRVTGREKQ